MYIFRVAHEGRVIFPPSKSVSGILKTSFCRICDMLTPACESFVTMLPQEYFYRKIYI